MGSENKRDLNINGKMRFPGGDFDNISVNGILDIDGDTKCDNLKVLGIFNVDGDLTAVSTKINGKTKITKAIKTDSMNVLGKADIAGGGTFKSVEVDGSLVVGSNLVSENVKVNGHLTIEGDCNCESFTSKGVFTISGLLNSDNINVRLHSNCKAKEIGGSTIDIRRGDEINILGFVKLKFDKPNFKKGMLETDSIEGDEVFIEYTKAKIVRAHNIKIGAGCEIDLVEYKGTCEIDPDANVKEKRMAAAVEV